jgi:putative FmdB family regulatory protein
VPTYSYACTECDNRFDAVQAFTDDALTTCPKCDGRLRKLFGKVGVVFKGSGFYRTDNRESAKAASGGSASSGSESSSSSSEKSSEKSSDKPAEKSKSTDKSSSSSGSSDKSSSSSSSSTAAASS